MIRDHVLSAARYHFPNASAARRGWLHYLIKVGAYADAARHGCETLTGAVDSDMLFFTIALLRLQQDSVVPAFMDDKLFDALRADVLAQVPSTGADFRCVMHDHIVALGGVPQPWPKDGVPAYDSAEVVGFRRLFAVTTGRLSRVSTDQPADGVSYIRPVLAISGQLRGFETAWASIHRHLCRPVDAPVIVTIWDKSANATGRHARRLERVLPADIIAQLKPEERYTDAFEAAYPETYRLLFSRTEVEAQSVRALIDRSGCEVLACETESEDLIAHLLPPHVSPNMLKMYYKFARIEALINAAETRSGEVFSHVIWSRPDCEILRLAPSDLTGCLARADLVWSSFTTETSFGDYVMVLPRRAFAAIAAIFPRVVTAAHTRLMPWRPNRSVRPDQRRELDAFGGPDVLFDVLLAAGYIPLARIPRMDVRLLGRMPGIGIVTAVFATEKGRSLSGSR